jgi:hypothetical protein
MTVDALLAVLREQAASPDQGPKVDPGRNWQWDVKSDAVRMRAYTKAVPPDPEKAWQAALALRDAVVALGYESRHGCEVAAVSEGGPRYDSPIYQWHGYVSLVFATK